MLMRLKLGEGKMLVDQGKSFYRVLSFFNFLSTNFTLLLFYNKVPRYVKFDSQIYMVRNGKYRTKKRIKNIFLCPKLVSNIHLKTKSIVIFLHTYTNSNGYFVYKSRF